MLKLEQLDCNDIFRLRRLVWKYPHTNMTSSVGNLWNRYEKWLRLMTVVHHSGKEICYNLLFTKRRLPTDGKSLFNFLKINEKRINPDEHQKSILYPPNEKTDPFEFDIPLYTKIIQGYYGRYYYSLVKDLRTLRNKMFHKGNAELTEKEFKDLWEEISRILQSHDFDMDSVAKLKDCNFSQLQEYENPLRGCIEGFIQGNKESLIIYASRYLIFSKLFSV